MVNGDLPCPRCFAPSIHAHPLYTRRFNSPFGWMLAVADTHSLYLLEFIARRNLAQELARLAERLQGQLVFESNALLEETEQQLIEYARGQRQQFTLPIALLGTDFQQQVWHALLAIPYGETRSYSALAATLGRPQSTRAVAHANGTNRLAILVPCHRLLGKQGALTGYSGGLDCKAQLLTLEQKHHYHSKITRGSQ